MRTTKTTPKGWMLRLLSALFMLSGLTACSSTEDSVEDSAKPKPEVPVNDDDWQTLPVAGGTITKDSISITFPSGTFSEETKVAITEIQKGKIGGEFEASKFYQLTMPVTTKQPITLNLKTTETGSDIAFIVRSDGYSISSGLFFPTETRLDYTATAEGYKAKLPVFENGENPENSSLIIGAVHLPPLGQGSTRSDSKWTGQVGNIKYEVNISSAARKKIDATTLKKIESDIGPKVHEYVKTALTKIQELGFMTKEERNKEKIKERTLNVSFRVASEAQSWYEWSKPEYIYGWHDQSCMNDKWSSISIGIEKSTAPDADELSLKQTVIHELFHYYQAEYDPRTPWKKASPQYDPLVMYEMGGPWVEQFVNEGQLNSDWLFKNGFSMIFSDRTGLTDIRTRWDVGGSKKVTDRYQNQGYTMSPLLYYFCSNADMKIYGFSNKSAVNLYTFWGKNFMDQENQTLRILDNWIKEKDYRGGISAFIDDYYLELLTWKFVKGLDIFKAFDYILKPNWNEKVRELFVKHAPIEGINYPYGYGLKSLEFIGLKDVTLKDKRLVVKQEEKGMQTYLLTANRTDKKYKRIGTVATGQDSIVVSGDKLESYRKADGTFDQYFFFVTTRTSNSTSDTGAKPWKVTVEIMNAKKEEDKFEPRTDITSVDIHWRSSTTGGNWANEDNNKFKYNNMLDTGRDNPIQVSKSGNTISVSGKKKRSSIDVFDCDIEYSFTINYTSKGYGEITDLSLSGSGNAKIGNETISLYDLSLAASHIGYESQSKRTTSESVTWGSTEAEGLKISKFTMKYDSGGNTPTSLTYQSDPTNNVWINIDFGE